MNDFSTILQNFQGKRKTQAFTPLSFGSTNKKKSNKIDENQTNKQKQSRQFQPNFQTNQKIPWGKGLTPFTGSSLINKEEIKGGSC